MLQQFYSSPTKQSDNRWTFYNPGSDDSNSEDEDYIQDEDDSSTDDDASQELHNETSDYDEETSEFGKKARKQTRNSWGIVQNQGLNQLDLAEIEEEAHNLQDDDDPPIMDSSEECSYEDDDHGEAIKRKSIFARYDPEANIPIFSIGMIFSGRVQFKEVLVKYGLATRRHLIFRKGWG